MAYDAELDGNPYDGSSVKSYGPGANYLSATSYALQGAASLGGAYEQYTALKAQGDFQVTMAKINQSFASLQADDAMRAGSFEQTQIRKKADATVGAQRVAAAAQGISVNDAQGSIGDKIDDTKTDSALDISTAGMNAWKTAWGIKTNAAIGVTEAEFDKSGKDFAANSTLLTGGLKAAGDFAAAGGMYAKASGSYSSTAKTSTNSVAGGSSNAKAYDAKKYSGWWS